MGVGCEIDSIRVLSILYCRIERVKPLFFRQLTRDLVFCTTFSSRKRERDREIDREREREGERERERERELKKLKLVRA